MQFSKASPLKSGESSEKSSGENRVKSCHVCGCHGFFGPDLEAPETLPKLFWALFGPRGQKDSFGDFFGDSLGIPGPKGPGVLDWKKGKDPHPQDKIQHLDFTKDPRPLYYKTALCILPQKCL